MESGEVSSEVCELVEYVWQAAVGELTDILAVPIENVKMEQVGILCLLSISLCKTIPFLVTFFQHCSPIISNQVSAGKTLC